MDQLLTSLIGCIIIIAAVAAIIRGVDVRLALLSAGVLMCAVAGDIVPVFKKFLETLVDEKYIIPIGTALGFAHVLRLSECDRHLVMLLLKPLQRVRWLLVPGSVVVGFVVNIAVISQAGTAIAVATVLVPLLRSLGIKPAVIAATLVLGASVGGELLNPGAPELQSVVKQLSTPDAVVEPRAMQPFLVRLLAVQLAIATLVFWWMTSKESREDPTSESPTSQRVSLIKALTPFLPLVLLLSAGAPLNLFHVPERWLVDPAMPETYSTRLIGASMIVGTIYAVLATPRIWRDALKTFFEGVGYAMANIISIIVAANCFGTGIKSMKLAEWVVVVTKLRPGIIWPVAGGLTFLFAIVSGSGMAATESLYRFFAHRDWPLETNLAVGAVTAIAAAAGRTTSPAAAVILVCAPLVGVSPMDIVRRVFWPLGLATAVTVMVAAITY